MTLAEITARGLPSLLVPYPFAADGHQEANARALEQAGAAVVVGDEEAGQGRLGETVLGGYGFLGTSQSTPSMDSMS